MRLTLIQLWHEIRGHRPPAPALRGTPPSWADDELELLLDALAPGDDHGGTHHGAEEDYPDADELDSIAGVCVEIVYRDSRGREGARRITCRNLTRAKDVTYICAYCHERQAPRQFRADRVQMVIDPETGECLTAEAFLSEFAIDRESDSGLTWGLPVRTQAQLTNALRVLAFMGRCDRDWHPLEMDVIEEFIAIYWLRKELPGEPPMDDVLKVARRMSPEPEDFFVSMLHVAKDPPVAQLLKEAICAVIDADGLHAAEEVYWGNQVASYLAGGG